MFSDKLNKDLNASLAELGFEEPTPLQKSALAPFHAGSDLYITAPDSSGKSTLIVIAALQKLKAAFEDAPRALVMVIDKEKALDMEAKFKELGRYTDLRIVTVYEGGPLDIQRENIYIGADVVIGTPKRLQEIYFQNGINLNKLSLFVLDDTRQLISKGLQVQINRLWQSIPKCQQLILSDKTDHRITGLADEFMKTPRLVEIS